VGNYIVFTINRLLPKGGEKQGLVPFREGTTRVPGLGVFPRIPSILVVNNGWQAGYV
jgi:hypothetical protein